MERYAARNIAIHRTDFQGAITVKFVPGQAVAVSSFRDRERHYWQDSPMHQSDSTEP
jgi:beta-lactamase superfamily II metal-dependent hydrolase